MADTPTADALIATAAAGWGYAESARVDGWHLRAADGFTHRANSAWPLGPLARPLPQAVAAVGEWYAQRALPALIQVAVGSELDVALVELGYGRADALALRQTARVADVLDTLLSVAPIGVKETFADEPTDDWLSLYRDGGVPPVARRVLGSGDTLRYATVYDADTGAPVAIGRAALITDPDTDHGRRWVGLSAVETAPLARRRGLAKLVIDALLEWADEQGATDAFLEVTPTNEPAVALYAALGFTTHHKYHCRVIG
ncbi:GNAT family N-acetyltransferase [Actinocrinis puniceicyclus]|uniref:GNAT family N-acetyltransferase n=1 Tax=Actinocrinis puniceicyclus TaxID=977794 RepID=A0A8J7WP88_9ACTN|nr:GNAT family N-acetyltransferase [Actinocrinis puniceicyclus]MBS2964340.1 GNAT family N-acetyltransferase [Actinocrinis puniceicyclus]